MKPRPYIEITFVILLTALSTNLRAGSWSSGGGNLLKDANNPWFIQNAESVTYCLEVSESGLSMDKSRLLQWAIFF